MFKVFTENSRMFGTWRILGVAVAQTKLLGTYLPGGGSNADRGGPKDLFVICSDLRPASGVVVVDLFVDVRLSISRCEDEKSRPRR